MPYKRRDPVPEKEMTNPRFEGHHSICQTLRDIYGMTDNEDVRLKLRLAMAMAKAMNKQLQNYKRAQEVQALPKS